MRSFAPLGAAAALALATLTAQTPLTTPFDGTADTTSFGAVYFDLNVLNPAGITLTALTLHCSSNAGTTGSFEIWSTPGTYFGNSTDPSAWTLESTAPATSAGPGAQTVTLLDTAFHLAPGSHGLLVAGVGLKQRFTPGVSCSGSAPGSCTNSAFGTQDVTFAGGATSLAAFSTITIPSRIWNGAIHYQPGQIQGVQATVGTAGMGSYASVYRYFPDAVAARAYLEGNSMTFTPELDSYRVGWGGGTFVPPGPTAQTLNLSPTDDGSGTIVLPSPLRTPQGLQPWLSVSGNGFVYWGALVAPSFPGTDTRSPTPAGFLGCNLPGIFSWHDYNEAEPGSGRIVWDTAWVGGHQTIYVTFDNVENRSDVLRPNPSTLQFQFDLVTSVCTLVWQHIDDDTTSFRGSAHLVGYSPGGPHLDPGQLDFATELPLVLTPFDRGPSLAGNAPQLGHAWQLTSRDHVAAAPFGMMALGVVPLAANGLDLAQYGARGSRLYHDAGVGVSLFPVANGQGQYAVAVPGSPALFGIVVHAQSLAWTDQNALHWATSNDVVGRLGF